MTDFLTDLLRRSRGQAGGLAPRLPSLFEPVAEAALQPAADEPAHPVGGWPPPTDRPAPALVPLDEPGRPASGAAVAPPLGVVAARGPADGASQRPPAARPEVAYQRLDELEWRLTVPAEAPPPERRADSPAPARPAGSAVAPGRPRPRPADAVTARPQAREDRASPAATTAPMDAVPVVATTAPAPPGTPGAEAPAPDRPDGPPPPPDRPRPPRPGRLTAPARPDPPAAGPRRPQLPPAAGDLTAAPTVHVTIGRVEIRAVPAPPPARRPPAARTTSLDDYLSERNRRRQG
jgi:hypothetical protein